ncbi:MAG: diguanylate cyclase [Ramlibacter sp.]|nr:diguanylate cyclase [Ramlibacter sp.]
MTALELMIWSMALGAIASVALARIADGVARPGRGQWLGVAYHLVVMLGVVVLSNIAKHAGLSSDGRLTQALQVLVGPVCVAISNFWIRAWLKASQRDRIMSAVLRGSALLLPLGGVGCLALPLHLQLPAAAALSLTGAAATLWLTIRAWMLGDRLAAVMAIGCFFVLPAIAGLYTVAAGVEGMSAWLHALFALSAVLANGFIGFVLWQRNRQERQARREHGSGASSRFDAVTKLHSGAGLVQKLLKAQRRRRRMRRDGAVIAIMIFDADRIAMQVGTAGLNEMYIAIASRIQRQVGVVNTVGRYYDRCFISLVETIPSPSWLRTLGLRVASSLRRPIELSSLAGERIRVRVDIGVGVVHLSGGPEPVEDLLHDAQRMAEAARQVPSRAAMLDPTTGEVVAVEQANLGPRRHRHAHRVQPVI